MSIKYDFAVLSCSGDRDYNEDCIQVQESEGQILFALADGLGGMGGGTISSSLAIQGAMELFLDRNEEFTLDYAMECAQKAVRTGQMMHPDADKMSSTLVLLQFKDGTASWIHIGDSRLYMFRDNLLYMMTEDHSVPQMLVSMGEITPDQIRNHQDRNRLLRTLGLEEEIKEELPKRSCRLQDKDAFLICSDGFWELIREKEMSDALQTSGSSNEWLSAMRKVVEKRGRDNEMDNYSAICVIASQDEQGCQQDSSETAEKRFINKSILKVFLIIILTGVLTCEIMYILSQLSL